MVKKGIQTLSDNWIRMSKKIAIIGYSFRLPGTDKEHLWQDLLEGRNLITEVDQNRWAKDGFLHPDKNHPGTSYTFKAGSIGDVSLFTLILA